MQYRLAEAIGRGKEVLGALPWREGSCCTARTAAMTGTRSGGCSMGCTREGTPLPQYLVSDSVLVWVRTGLGLGL